MDGTASTSAGQLTMTPAATPESTQPLDQAAASSSTIAPPLAPPQASSSSAPTNPYAHLTPTRFAQALRNLDASLHAPNSNAADGAPSDGSCAPVKRRRVEDVLKASESATAAGKGAVTSPLGHLRANIFGRLSGLGAMQRERKRAASARSSSSSSSRLSSSGALPVGTPSDSARESGVRATTYAPFSLPLLVERLATFGLSAIGIGRGPCSGLDKGPLGLACRGWSAKGRQGVRCQECKAEWDVLERSARVEPPGTDAQAQAGAGAEASSEGKEQDEAKERHAQWCPWRIRGCDASLYRLPPLSRQGTLKHLRDETARLAEIEGIDELIIEDPLTDEERVSLLSILSSPKPGSTEQTTPSLNATLLALFEWSVVPRAPALPSSSTILAPPASTTTTKLDVGDTTLQCRYCARRIGLWGFARREETRRTLPSDSSSSSLQADDAPPQAAAAPASGSSKRVKRTLDASREHRTFCPLVNGVVQQGLWGSASASGSSKRQRELSSSRFKASSEDEEARGGGEKIRPPSCGFEVRLDMLLRRYRAFWTDGEQVGGQERVEGTASTSSGIMAPSEALPTSIRQQQQQQRKASPGLVVVDERLRKMRSSSLLGKIREVL